MSRKKTIVVIGGAHGGPSAVARARQVNEQARIILIERAPFVTWVQAGLRYHLTGDEQRIKASLLEKEQYFQGRYNVEVMTNTEALSLDMDAKTILVRRDNDFPRIPFDSLIFAGGALSNRLDVAGLSGERVCNFRNLNDVAAVKSAVNEGARHAVVVGCGLYGVDAALALKASGLDVIVIEKRSQIMPRFSASFSALMLEKMAQLGIKVLCNDTVHHAKKTSDNGFLLMLKNNTEVKTDLVVECIGTTPRTSLLAEAGAALDPSGLIRVDDEMATTLPNVYACGSSVSVPFALLNERMWMPQPAIVLRTAHIAGNNAATKDETKIDRIKPFSGTLMSEIGDTLFARTGLNEHKARSTLGHDNVLVTTVFGYASETWAQKHEMCVRLLVDRKQHQVIGGEVSGHKGVERRIDLISVAVKEGWSPEKLIDLDMAYFAGSGPAFDPLKNAALRASQVLSQDSRILGAEELALWLANRRNFRLIDVSEEPALSGKRSRTLHVPLEKLRNRLSELSINNEPIVLFSRSGHRSHLAQLALNQLGHDQVYHLDGGVHTLSLVTEG